MSMLHCVDVQHDKKRTMCTIFRVQCHTGDCFACAVGRLVGQVVEASASGAEGPEFGSRLPRDFSGSSHTSDLKIGIIGSVLGLVGQVSVYCDWVR